MSTLHFIKDPFAHKTKWSNKDFVLYFSSKLKEKTGQGLFIPNEGWYAFISRVKGFRLKMALNELQYKGFIDKVIDVFFAQSGYVPTFGSIVSEKVYYIVKTMEKPVKEYTNDEFIQLRDKLLGDIDIAFKVD